MKYTRVVLVRSPLIRKYPSPERGPKNIEKAKIAFGYNCNFFAETFQIHAERSVTFS